MSRPDNASRISAVGSLAERAYQQVRSDLLHDLSLKPLLVIFNTRGDLEQALADGGVMRLDLLPGDGPRILLWYDDPSLPGTLVHEVTHAFIFDIIPPSGREDLPIWIHEGLADHERGDWREPDLALLRDMVRANAVPTMTAAFSGDRRLHRILGHATFDFIVSRVGKDGVRRFLAALRNDPTSNLVGVYRTAFGPAFDDFNRGFEQYLRTRFPEQPQA